eukprot:430392-Pleurochrysis_carterae.AAC.10
MTSGAPRTAARWRAVRPCTSSALQLHSPDCTSVRTTSAEALRAAKCSGRPVVPSSSSFTSGCSPMEARHGFGFACARGTRKRTGRTKCTKYSTEL